MEHPHEDVRVLEIVVAGGESIALPLDDILSETAFYVSTLAQEHAPVALWLRAAEELWRLHAYAKAINLLHSALQRFPARSHDNSRVPLLCILATYHIALARTAPRTILIEPFKDTLSRSTHPDHPERSSPSGSPDTKEYYYQLAVAWIKEARELDPRSKNVLDAQATLALVRGKLDDAAKAFDILLQDEPNHLYALTGKARIAFARKNYRPALKLYSTVLSYAPKFLPDPRIGMGLCFWMMGDHSKARKAWERSTVVHPESDSRTATVLLGLAEINESKAVAMLDDSEGRASAYEKGIGFMSSVWMGNKTNPTVAATLAAFSITTGRLDAAIKLSERAIQYADSKVLVAESHLLLARALHGQGKEAAALVEYGKVIKLIPDHPVAMLAVAQTSIRAVDFPSAANTLERTLRSDPRCIEALVTLASIHTHLAHSTHSIIDSSTERKRAKEYYDQATRLFALGRDTISVEGELIRGIPMNERTKELSNDPDLFVEIAKLWIDEVDSEKSLRAYLESSRIYSQELSTDVPARLLNNIAVLDYLKGDFGAARERFQGAATNGSKGIVEGVVRVEDDAVLTAVNFNLGVVAEALDEVDEAKSFYQNLLGRHPEFVDAKARLALLSIKSKDFDKAHALIKETLNSQPNNLEIRALYTYYLHISDSSKLARDFAINTLKEYSRHDIYALCAAGWIQYTQARELKDGSKEGAKERATKFLRAAEFYEKALLLDSNCAFAAQGLAISIAEGTLGIGSPSSSTSSSAGDATNGGGEISESTMRMRNSRDALTILMRVKDSMRDGSVHVNIGHCHFVREEWERAIESYETASRRYFKGKNVSTLLYLARSWYHKANKDQSFADLRASLVAIEAAKELQPTDLAILFNLAMVQQKGLEIILDRKVQQRTLAQLNQAIEDANLSQKLLLTLPDGSSKNTPYQQGLPYQRSRFGLTLLNRSAEAITLQTSYEITEASKISLAKSLRDTERTKLEELELMRVEEEEERKKKLGEQRRILRDEARGWLDGVGGAGESDEEEKKSRKRKGKAKKEEVEGSSEEEDEKPKKKKKAKAVEQEGEMEEDGDEAVRTTRKAFKSAQYIEASDEEED